MFSSLRNKSFGIVMAVLIVILLAGQSVAYASVPYVTYYKDHFNQLYETQPAYTPAGVFGRDLSAADPNNPGQSVPSPLKKAQDLFIDAKDHIYIADTGNNRIVHLNERGELVRFLTVKESPLNKPEGLFIDPEGHIYIADTGNKRVVKLGPDGSLLRDFKRPESKFLPAAFKFDPVKLAVDKRGFLFIASLGGYQGLLKLDQNGQFLSYFGANQTPFTLTDAMKRIFYTREMYRREISKRPGSVTSVTTDAEGFIYTVSSDLKTGQVKKLNIAGLDMLEGKDEYSDAGAGKSFGESLFPSKNRLTPKLADITVDRDGNMTVIDSNLKIVSQYDRNGNLLFFWGGENGSASTKLGVVKMPTAVAHNSKDELFILDGENNVVQVFRLSEFGALVHRANHLTQSGRYEQSREPWQEVNRLNAYYTPSLLGLAKAAYKRGDNELAQQLFKQAGHTRGFSEAFWQQRLKWFHQKFGKLMNAAVIAIILIYAGNRLLRLRAGRGTPRTGGTDSAPFRFLLLDQLKHIFTLIKHPLEGFSALRYEQKGGFWSSLIVFLLAAGSYSFMEVKTSFVFNSSAALDFNILKVLVPFLAVWFGWVISNYFVSAIYQGEGRFRDIVYGSSYALFPFILVGLPITLISNVMTLNEASVFHFLQTGLYLWVCLLLFWNVQALQNYSVGETAVNIALSFLTMIICLVIVFILVALTTELVNFLYSVYQEVMVR